MIALPPDGDLMLLQMGGMGDLVLLAGAAAALRRARPGGRIVLACRETFAPVAGLWPEPPDAVIGLDLDPAAWEAPAPGLTEAVRAALRPFAARRAVALVDAAQRPGWFGPVLAAALGVEAAWCCPGAPEVPRHGLRALLLHELGLAAVPVETVIVPPRLHELARHDAWLAALGAGPAARRAWAVPEADRAAAGRWLARAGLPAGGFIACHPGGATALKHWPRAGFAAVLRETGLPVLLLGGVEDRAALQAVADGLAGLPSAVMAGGPLEMPLTAALLAQARGWLANDSGPMHLAQALGVPGVGVFGGGGRFPAYTPWGPGAVGVVGPLPCFGCDWDCVLGHALCIERIPVETVATALRGCLEAPSAAPAIIALDGPEPALRDLLADASDSYRASQRDRDARLEAALAGRLDAVRLGAMAEERRAALESAAASTAALESEAGRLRRVAEERLAALERAAASAAAWEAEAGRLRDVADEHRTAREAADAEASRCAGESAQFRQAAEERLGLLEAVHAEAARRATLIETLSAEVAVLRDAANARLEALERVHAEAAARERGIVHAWQVSIGLGAGNIGDELMNHAFWSQLPQGIVLDVPLFPEAARQRQPYPRQHRYPPVDWHGNENAAAQTPGLLVGATPVTEAEGLDWPLRFLAPRLRHFHERGLPVDALGVGIEPLSSPEARAMFHSAFLPVRSWTVRSARCRDALLELGVAPDRVAVGADWAWLHRPARDCRDWARTAWAAQGVDPDRPLLVANVVNMLWREAGTVRDAIAAGLDDAARRHGLQIAFLCNECREGAFFDRDAARDIAERMRTAAVILPNEYYAPDEAIALLGHATVTVGQRYHFVIESVLAGTVPISIPRGVKQQGLAAELGIPEAGSVAAMPPGALGAAIDEAMARRAVLLGHLAMRQRDLAQRAARNLDLIRALPPYAAAFGVPAG